MDNFKIMIISKVINAKTFNLETTGMNFYNQIHLLTFSTITSFVR